MLCKAKRVTELRQKKKKWNVKTTQYGFALLDVSSLWKFIANRFVDPFTRFYFEGYLQTVLVSDLSHTVYNHLVNSVTEKEIRRNYNYRIMSKYFEMAAKLGGVSIFFCCTLIRFIFKIAFVLKKHCVK